MIDAASLENLRRVDPRAVCRALGFGKDAVRHNRGFLVRCPFHGDRTPSCSIFQGRAGRLRVHCFGCGFSGDLFDLVATIHHLPLSGSFAEVVGRAAELLGTANEVVGAAVALPAPRSYPKRKVVAALWRSAGLVLQDAEVAALLATRSLDAVQVGSSLARAIAPKAALPSFARTRRGSWCETDHRLIVRMFDALGRFRSLRAWRISGTHGGPKRLPPSGYRADRLVMLNREGWELLTQQEHGELLIVEGEPDFLTAAVTYNVPIWGIVAGSWGPAFAAAIPGGSRVLVATHPDSAGDRYASEIRRSLGERVELLEVQMSTNGLDLNDLLSRGLLPPDLFAVAKPFNLRASNVRERQRPRAEGSERVDAAPAGGAKG